MPGLTYFDTAAFRHIGTVYSKAVLADDLRDRVLISPLTVFEVFSQLTIQEANEVLQQIHAVLNYVNPKRTGLLPWPDAAIQGVWFGKTSPDDGFTERMQKAFNTCLHADSADTLREEAGNLRDAIDDMNQKTAEEFGRLLEAARKEGVKEGDFSSLWFNGMARRIKAEPDSKKMQEVVDALSAYHEFEESKLKTALANEDYKPLKHKNDLLDAEQLVYLNDANLRFLTCDKGFAGRVRKSPQAARICTVTLDDLADAPKIEALIRKITD
jgi:hypothetical protein